MHGRTTVQAGSRLFHGWLIVALAIMVMCLIFGTRFSMGLFLPWLPEALDTSPASVALIFAVSTFVAGATQPFAGLLADRWGPTRVVVLGLTATGASFIGAGFSVSLWQMMLLLGVASGAAFSCANLVVLSALIARWFRRKRGQALGIVTAGTKIGVLLIVPLTGAAIAAFGWRAALVLLGLAVLSLVPPAWLFMRADPESIGLLPDGDRPPTPAADVVAADPAGEAAVIAMQGPEPAVPLNLAVRSGAFWLIAASLFGNGFMMNLVYLHLPSYMLQLEYGPAAAASALAVLGGVGIVGNVLTGTLSDWISRKLILAVLYASRALVTLLVVLHPGPVSAVLFVVVFGFLGYGAVGVSSALTADIFGRGSIGANFGMAYVAHQFGGALGIYAGGLSVEMTGSYSPALAMAIAVSALSMIAVLSVTGQSRSRPGGA